MIRAFSLIAFGAVSGAAIPLAVLQDDDAASHLIERPVTETFTALNSIELSVGDAMNKAAAEVGGKAADARFVVDNGECEITVYTAETTWTVKTDGAGNITEKREEPPFILPGAPVSGAWTEEASGLKYWDLYVGEGEMPPRKESRVKVHYTGWTVDGKKFDSSVDRGTPATFTLSGVIAGWTEGVGSMRVGGKRKLIIPYELAYLAAGRPPQIPPKAMLIFDVELVEIVAP